MSSSLYQSAISISRYQKNLWDEGRRETFEETVDRFMERVVDKAKFGNMELSNSNHINGLDADRDYIRSAILNKQVMPSARLLAMSGDAADANHIKAYNCAAASVSHPDVFAECFMILLSGTGFGFSVESKYIDMLPDVRKASGVDYKFVVEDSAEGWCKALRALTDYWFCVTDARPVFDYSLIRTAGSPLKTTGGTASGPGALQSMLYDVGEIFLHSGARLSSIDAHDIMCSVASCVVVGGVRRSAMISLSDIDDEDMAFAKGRGADVSTSKMNGRYYANNSFVIDEPISRREFDNQWDQIRSSGSGERGIYNRKAIKDRYKNHRRDGSKVDLTNPCSEITLRDMQFCNLTEVVLRDYDSKDDIVAKVKAATILGTIQAALFDSFPLLRKEWESNTQDERLLGVSLTGICDVDFMRTPSKDLASFLSGIKQQAIDTNKEFSEQLGINPSAAVTCIKPSGTISQLCDSSSGIHPRFSRYYIRRLEIDEQSSIKHALDAAGVTYNTIGKKNTRRYEFPIKSPDNCAVAGEFTWKQQLDLIMFYDKYWCEHKVSGTIYVPGDQWDNVRDYIYKNIDSIYGTTVFPMDDNIYTGGAAVLEEINKKTFEEMSNNIKEINIEKYLSGVDKSEDASLSIECSSGACVF